MRPESGSRRAFLGWGMAGSAAAVALPASGAPGPGAEGCDETFKGKEYPVYCAHEHWGSIGPLMGPEGFRADLEAGALPSRPVSVWDLVFDPYGGGWLRSEGVDWDIPAREAGKSDFFAWWGKAPEQALASVTPALRRHRTTGVFQCTARGVVLLHGKRLEGLDCAAWSAADRKVGEAYGALCGWYRQAMEKASLRNLIRPVHPEYYLRGMDTPAGREEASFTRSVLRVEGFLDLWRERSPRREVLADAVGVDPVDAKSWREFIGRVLDLAARSGAVGIKQLQAYSRSLDFQPREDGAVVFRGDLDAEQQRAFEDWVVHVCCAQANDRGWPFQCHVGTNNLAESSPLPLEPLARRYPRMALVQLHCWPFAKEAGYLAKMVPNMHIDACWQPILNPAFLRESLGTWMGYVPVSKLMFSNDATSVEMAAGAADITRRAVWDAVSRRGGECGLGPEAAGETVKDMLHNNAARLYGGAPV